MISSGLTRRGLASGFGSFIWTRNQRAYECIVARLRTGELTGGGLFRQAKGARLKGDPHIHS